MLNPEGIYFVSFARMNWMGVLLRQHYYENFDEKKGQSMWNYYFRNDICSCNRFGTSYKLAPNVVKLRK